MSLTASVPQLSDSVDTITSSLASLDVADRLPDLGDAASTVAAAVLPLAGATASTAIDALEVTASGGRTVLDHLRRHPKVAGGAAVGLIVVLGALAVRRRRSDDTDAPHLASVDQAA